MRAKHGEPLRVLRESLMRDTDDCIVWPFGRNGRGYGQVRLGTSRAYVHVLACEARHGPRPEGREAAHTCGNSPCFNPRHLRWATPKENAADCNLYGRPHRPGAKLTEADVAEIRSQYTGHYGQMARLARRYGVTTGAIANIVRGRSWSTS